MSGDSLASLPVNKDRIAKPGELEIVYNLFQRASPKQMATLVSHVISPFKSALLGAVLFGILSLPFIFKMMDGIFKNPLYARGILMLIFLITFWALSKAV